MEEDFKKLINNYNNLIICPKSKLIQQWLKISKLPFIIINSSELNERRTNKKSN